MQPYSEVETERIEALKREFEGEPETIGLTGKIEKGDEVKTLHLKRALYGVVMGTNGAYAFIEGEEQPGSGLRKLKVSVENLMLIKKGSKTR